MARLLRVFAALAAICISKATDPTENADLLDFQLFQGDVLLTPNQQSNMQTLSNPNDPFAPMHAVSKSIDSQWPNGIVYYIYDSSITDDVQDVIQSAMSDYNDLTCITFQPRTTQADYVRFFRGQGCYSYIGKIGGPQDISIGQGCAIKGIVIHEIFHALGRWHEQSRPDRDQFVQINLNNVEPGFESNFDILSTVFVTTQGVPYDYSSIMHYGAYAFSINNQPTIVPIQPGVTVNSIGQRTELSPNDLAHVSALYCSDDPGTWSDWSSWSSCSQTCNGGTRTRTRTCVGGTNCEGTNIQTELCNTNSCPVEPTWSAWSSWSGCSASCGGGVQTRQRVCEGGNTCVGEQTQYQVCSEEACPQPAVWASWSSWSSCSATCAGGTRYRTRQCVNGNNCVGESLQVEECNQDVDCNPFPDLIGEEHVGCYLVPSYSSYLKLLEGKTPYLSDDPLTRTQPVAKCGLGAYEYGYHIFGVAIGYCISGSDIITDYTKYHYPGYCEDGEGGIYQVGTYTYFFMDLYKIVDAPSFTVSADQAIKSDLSPSPSPSPSTENPNSSPEPSGAGAVSYSLLLLSVSLVIGLAALLL